MTKSSITNQPANLDRPDSESLKRDVAYQRVLDYRDRLKSSPDELSRWEIVASDHTRSEVKRIAKENNISPGVAADALLGLGLEAYKQRGALLASASASASEAAMPAPFVGSVSASLSLESRRSISPQAFAASLNASTGAEALTKPLATYSSRLAATSSTSADSAPPGVSATTPLDGFLAKALARKTR